MGSPIAEYDGALAEFAAARAEVARLKRLLAARPVHVCVVPREPRRYVTFELLSDDSLLCGVSYEEQHLDGTLAARVRWDAIRANDDLGAPLLAAWERERDAHCRLDEAGRELFMHAVARCGSPPALARAYLALLGEG